MYVTDTPVIDRLTNPGPMDQLYEVTATLCDSILDGQEALQLSIDEQFGPLVKKMEPLDAELGEDLRDHLFHIGGDLCANEMDRQHALLRRVEDEMQSRLGANA